jgi:hypothetical protein
MRARSCTAFSLPRQKARIGDHLWWISSLEAFKREYPECNSAMDIRATLQEIYGHKAERRSAERDRLTRERPRSAA